MSGDNKALVAYLSKCDGASKAEFDVLVGLGALDPDSLTEVADQATAVRQLVDEARAARRASEPRKE
jgi:hypothetical protein